MAGVSVAAALPRSFRRQRAGFAAWVVGSLPIRLSRAYNGGMIRAYEEIVDFIAAGTTPRTVARFEPSQETKDRVADLIHREKTTGLAPEEASELDQYLRMEHMMRLAKARAGVTSPMSSYVSADCAGKSKRGRTASASTA